MKEISQNNLFPVFLKLEEMNVLIVGGGNVGLEKLTAVLKNSPAAKTKLVADTIRPEIVALSNTHSNLTLIHGEFRDNDLEGIDVAILATNNRLLNKEILAKAKAKKILVNVADTPDLCDFYLGSIVTKGHLKIAISTNGHSPTLAKRLREYFEEVLPDEMNDAVIHLRKVRDHLKGDLAAKVKELRRITSHFINN